MLEGLMPCCGGYSKEQRAKMKRRAFFASLGLLPGAITIRPEREDLKRYLFFVDEARGISPKDLETLTNGSPGDIVFEDKGAIAIFDTQEGKMVRDYE